MIVRQLNIGFMDNFTSIVGFEETKKALVIDPGADVDRIVSEAKKHEACRRHRGLARTRLRSDPAFDASLGEAKQRQRGGIRLLRKRLKPRPLQRRMNDTNRNPTARSRRRTRCG